MFQHPAGQQGCPQCPPWWSRRSGRVLRVLGRDGPCSCSHPPLSHTRPFVAPPAPGQPRGPTHTFHGSSAAAAAALPLWLRMCCKSGAPSAYGSG
eukprot:1161279-Pelagomonas_calceolata.AAC.3